MLDQRYALELQQHIAAAEQALSNQLGEGSACQLHKDGRVTGGMKYAECKLVALNDLRRKLNLDPATDDVTLYAIVTAEIKRWQDSLQRQQSSPAMSWLAYYQGGIDALEALQQAWLPNPRTHL